MDEENDKKGLGSNISAVFERIPILDGGGRRRLTAGTLVVLTAVLVNDSLRTGISTLLTNKDLSLSLALAGAGLLIYATGVIVELVGEVFLARAVSNLVWSYIEAYARPKTWRPLYGPIGWLYVSIWGSLRAVVYFVVGLFGASKWRMRPSPRLSENARQTFDRQPVAIRESIQCALGNNAEFGRKALIDQLRTPESRRWARTLMDRPKDVLALVSAIIISLTLYLFLMPVSYSVSPDVQAALAKQRNSLLVSLEQIETQFGSKEFAEIKDKLSAETEEAKDHDAVVLVMRRLLNVHGAMGRFRDLTDPSKLAASDTDSAFASSAMDSLFTASQEYDDACKGDDISKDAKLDNTNPALKPLVKALHSVCTAFDASNADGWIREAYQQVIDTSFEERFRRATYLFATLFLYIAFFNTLTATTLSVIELLAFQTLSQEPKPTSKPDPDPQPAQLPQDSPVV